MTIIFQEVQFMNPTNNDFSVSQIMEYFLSNYTSDIVVWSLPLTFPKNSVSKSN